MNEERECVVLSIMMVLVALFVLMALSGCALWRPALDTAIEIRQAEEQRKADERAAVEAERIAAEQAERERIEAEKQAAREAKAKQDAEDAAVVKVPVTLDYSKPWVITLTGDFRASGHQRYIQSGKTLRDGLDVFPWAGKLALRLYDRQIVFTGAAVGTLSTPKPPDHWGMTVPQGGLSRWSGVLRIEYHPAGACRIYRDGVLVGDWTFRIIKLPPIRRELWLRGFAGEVKVE